jgi:lipid II:glycine glycyltransferase (peptidoglycan interpeptide bridge formation enzyme)
MRRAETSEKLGLRNKQRYMEKPITTIEDLAELMIRTIASKEDVHALDKKVTEGFERIEHLLLAEQKREIEDLKTRMTRLDDALAV